MIELNKGTLKVRDGDELKDISLLIGGNGDNGGISEDEVKGIVDDKLAEVTNPLKEKLLSINPVYSGERTASGQGTITITMPIVADHTYKIVGTQMIIKNSKTANNVNGTWENVEIVNDVSVSANKAFYFVAKSNADAFRMYINDAGIITITDISVGLPKLEENVSKLMVSDAGSDTIKLYATIGGINYTTGENGSSAKRARSQYIKTYGKHIMVKRLNPSYKFLVFEYDEFGRCITPYTAVTWLSDEYETKNDGVCESIRIVVRMSDDTDFVDAVDLNTIVTVTASGSGFNSKSQITRINPYLYDGALEQYTDTNKLSHLYGLWDTLQSAYPDIISKEVVGMVGDVEMRCYTITNPAVKTGSENNRLNAKPDKILYISSIHGNEHEKAVDDYSIFKEIVLNHANGDALQLLWNSCTFKVIPVGNPVGYEANTRNNGNNVNINRNFSEGWEMTTDAYNSSGDSAFSEIETKLIANFISDNSDALVCFNSHDTEIWSEAGHLGYFTSTLRNDMIVLYPYICSFDDAVRKKFPDIVSDIPETNMLRLYTASTHGGTMDRWFNSIGVHGCLSEMATRPGTYHVSPETARKISISANIGAMASYVANAIVIKNNSKKF